MNAEEKNIELSILKSEIVKKAILKECFLSGKDCNCSKKIKSAHSLQKMGCLSILESDVNGNKMLYALTERRINPLTNLLELEPIGKKLASTFFGFCDYHDSEIFKPIEEYPELLNHESDEHCFLLCFRAFAISYHRKKEEINLFSTKDLLLKEKIEKYFNTDDINNLLTGSLLGLEDLEPNKEILISSLLSKDYSCLELLTYELNYTTPIAMCMSTSPPFLFNGRQMNMSSNPNYKYTDIMTSVIPLKKRTIVVLGSLKSDPLGATYLDELNRMDDISLQKALTWHILTNAENCFFSPIWYEKLSPFLKNYICELSSFSADVNTPYLKYYPEAFNLNLFAKEYAI